MRTYTGNPKVALYLVEHGASAASEGRNKETAVALARLLGNMRLAQQLESVENSRVFDVSRPWCIVGGMVLLLLCTLGATIHDTLNRFDHTWTTGLTMLTVLYGLAAFFYLQTRITGPRILEKPRGPAPSEEHLRTGPVCPVCRRVRARDTYHCYICRCCVCRYDRHCFWTMGCVGGQNLVPFTLWLLCQTSAFFVTGMYNLWLFSVFSLFTAAVCFGLALYIGLILRRLFKVRPNVDRPCVFGGPCWALPPCSCLGERSVVVGCSYLFALSRPLDI